MVAYLNPSVRIATEKTDATPRAKRNENTPGSPAAPRPSRLRSIAKSVWSFLVVAISGPGLGQEYKGIDDSAMPSGFIAPYKSGSRQVRNLWHQPF